MIKRTGWMLEMAAAQVAAQHTVTRRTLDNGKVKFEVVRPSDEAAIGWAARNTATANASAEPTPENRRLSLHRQPQKHQRLPTMAGSVPMRS
ncbi:MAG: hypothetical protein KBG15_05035 [Kofleriaceae bacterium]|nr:hypothetical protein [Kofleriaceae bacterium]